MSDTAQLRPATGQRRRQILDGALRCFMKHGVDATTMEQIRDVSGASHGSIYHHFGSKEAIALALYAEGMHEYQQRIVKELQRQKSAEAGICAIIGCHMKWIAEDRDRALYLTRVGTAEASGATAARIAEINRAFFHALHDWLRPFIERGEIVAVPEDLYVSLILGPTTHFSRHWLAGRETIDPRKAADVFAAAAWNALRNQRPEVGGQSSEVGR